ncbi:hypothetical protein L4D00_24170 [Photobacterium swingsii]|uniref:hypothetical protein n=1 Tax=Photobacterium swingsii TaxID=680026 RepID=UPI003D0AB7D2
MSNELINTLNKKDAADALIDLGEVVVDSFVDSDILSDIPILGTLAKLKNVGVSVSDYFFVKKLQKFIFALSSVSDSERNDFFTRMSSDTELQSRVNDNLMLLINATDDIDKPKLLGQIFASYIRHRISYEKFMKYSTSVNGMNSSQLGMLKSQTERKVEREAGHAMATFGLVIISIPTTAGSSSPEYYLNEDGAEYLNILYGTEVSFS